MYSKMSAKYPSSTIPLVYGEPLSPTVFASFILKRKEWFRAFSSRISQYFLLYNYRVSEIKNQSSISKEVNEFKSKITNTITIINLFKAHFSDHPKFIKACSYYYEHIGEIRHYLTFIIDGVRFRQHMMHDLDAESYNYIMTILNLENECITVKKSAVSFKL